MQDFFISYHSADQTWADWIAWQLEYAGYSTVAQASEPLPEVSVASAWQRAASEASHTIAILSEDYLKLLSILPDWAAALLENSTPEEGPVLPVRVRECSLEGLTPAFKCIDLVDLDQAAAWEALLSGVQRLSTRPAAALKPPPDSSAAPSPPPFPVGMASLPSIWNVPRVRNPYFTGRGGLLAALEHTLAARGVAALNQAVSGLGGLGKTQLAVEYAFRHAGEYDVVWWVRAGQSATLASDFADLAGPLGLPERDHPDQQVAIEAVRRCLSALQRWLLIFDSAERPEEIHPFIPRAAEGRMLITSRRTAWKWLGQALAVPLWTEQEGAEFLRRRMGAAATVAGVQSPPEQQQDDEADPAAVWTKLSDALDGLPLALELAAAYLLQTGTSPGRYLDLLHTHKRQMLSEGRPAADYPLSLAASWELSFRRVRKDCPAAASLLYLCAFLAPDDIRRALIGAGASYLPESLSAAAANAEELERAVGTLQAYSLAEDFGDRLSVHRLVQAVCRDRLATTERRIWAKAAVRLIYDAFPYKGDDRQTWPGSGRLLSHALFSAGYAEELGVAPEAAGRLLNQAGLYLQQRARFNDARAAFERALHIDEGAYGRDHPNVAVRASTLGRVLQEMGDLSGARAVYERALRIDVAACGPDSPTTARDANNLAAVLHQMGDLAGARMAIERALSIDEAAYGPDHPSVARDVSQLGSILRASGDRAGARAAYERALSIDQGIYGPDHPRVAIDASNLGRIRQEMGDLAGARDAYEWALRVDETAYGPDHPKVAIRVNNLGTVLYTLGDLAGAQAAFERALRIDKAAYGPDHARVAMDIGSLNRVLQDRGDLAGARSAYERALRIDEAAYGPDHPNVAIDLNNLGGVLHDLGDLIGARAVFERAQQIDRAAYGPDHLNVAMDANNLARVLQDLGDLAAARRAYQRALRILDESLGQDHPDARQVRRRLEALEG